MEASISAQVVLKRSIQGVQKEIDQRTWYINNLVERYEGRVSRFLKPQRNKMHLVNEALELHREVEKLKQIKRDLKYCYENNHQARKT